MKEEDDEKEDWEFDDEKEEDLGNELDGESEALVTVTVV